VPLTVAERDALANITRDPPRLWGAVTTTDRDRAELQRTLITEITITVVAEPRRAKIEILWDALHEPTWGPPLAPRRRADLLICGDGRADPPARRASPGRPDCFGGPERPAACQRSIVKRLLGGCFRVSKFFFGMTFVLVSYS
jgi:hypothetical protein